MLVWSIIQQGLPRFPYYYQHTGIPNELTTHPRSVSLYQSVSLTLSHCLSCLSLWLYLFLNLTTAHTPKFITNSHYCCAWKSPLAATLCNKNFNSKWKSGNGMSVTPNGMREGEGENVAKKACLIIFLITSVTIPKLFCTESAREYANRHHCTALVCWAWAGEKNALWCFLVLNFKRKVKNVSKNSLYNPRH